MLSALADPRQAPELLMVREALRSWRFYDQVRTDAGAPARVAQVGTRTPVLASDGADLAAALQTIAEIGDRPALDAAVERAFPGSSLEIDVLAGRFEVTMRQHGMLRPLRSAELSDGTVRYLLWVAALLTPRPPELLVLNEPETSLHHDLLAPLAELDRGRGDPLPGGRRLALAVARRRARASGPGAGRTRPGGAPGQGARPDRSSRASTSSTSRPGPGRSAEPATAAGGGPSRQRSGEAGRIGVPEASIGGPPGSVPAGRRPARRMRPARGHAAGRAGCARARSTPAPAGCTGT